MPSDLDPRALVAEAIGTALLLVGVVGSGIMAERLAGGNDGIALLANAGATGAILYVLITTLGPLSGAHFNPAVTIAFLLRGEIGARRAVAFIGIQVVFAILGVWLAHLMFEAEILQTSSRIRTGPSQWVAEVVATFGLLLAIFGGLKHAPGSVSPLVALYITGAYWFTASTSFANPAVTLARGLTDTFAGIAPANIAPFIASQVAGAVLAVLLCGWLFARR